MRVGGDPNETARLRFMELRSTTPAAQVTIGERGLPSEPASVFVAI